MPLAGFRKGKVLTDKGKLRTCCLHQYHFQQIAPAAIGCGIQGY